MGCRAWESKLGKVDFLVLVSPRTLQAIKWCQETPNDDWRVFQVLPSLPMYEYVGIDKRGGVLCDIIS